MIFIAIVIAAIVLYVLGYKCPALIVFFFFLTSGFNLIPEELMDVGPISKGIDFALIILLGILIVDTFCIKGYWKLDKLMIWLLVFGAMLMICVVYSKFSVGLGWAEIIRSSRYQAFWLAYFVFRNMEKKQLERLLHYLFNITFVLASLYVLQIIIREEIFVESVVASVRILGIKIPRYYNQPLMLHFFALMAIYYNPYKGVPRIMTTVILVAALLGAFHRSLLISFVLVVVTAYILNLPRLRRIQFVSVAAALLAVVIVFKGVELGHSRTFRDLKNVAEGNISDIDDIDMVMLAESTFSFRMAILFERNLYLLERPVTTLLGVGLLTEDSPQTRSFNFQIGLRDEITNEVVQTETGDISYATLTFRMGYLGTAAYLAVLIYLSVFFYKHRKNKYALTSFLFWILSFGVSFFSSNLLLSITYVIPLISYAIVRKTDQTDQTILESNE
jgi:hypothetical protein